MAMPQSEFCCYCNWGCVSLAGMIRLWAATFPPKFNEVFFSENMGLGFLSLIGKLSS